VIKELSGLLPLFPEGIPGKARWAITEVEQAIAPVFPFSANQSRYMPIVWSHPRHIAQVGKQFLRFSDG
jgi:hypothetical protein